MKTSKDPRHLRRVNIIKSLYASAFTQKPDKFARPIWEHLGSLDQHITSAAPQWPLRNINAVDLAILRLATYELLIDKQAPPKVIIDEAVELAKSLGSSASPSFINGVLGHILSKDES
jgi:N utilization substance protein B